MSEFFASGRAIDLVIAVLALEALLLWGVLRGRGGVMPAPTLLAAFGLLLAWRFGQAGAAWFWVALPLTLAGLAHGWDLWHRWPQR
jgi:hypothetical protein